MTAKTNAIVTASYGPDFERCRLLCETIDAHAKGYTKHYILVDNKDVALFTTLAGPKRVIVSDKQLLPWWLFRVPGAVVPGGKAMWVSPRTVPMRGWHMQQLRRIAVAHYVEEDALFFCDSDTAFIKEFDLETLWQGDALRLFCEPNAAKTALSDHVTWLDHAAHTIKSEAVKMLDNNYVRTFIAWRRDVVVSMCEHIEASHKAHWIVPIATSRKFSECTLYGAFADTVTNTELHWHDKRDFCAMHWFDPAPNADQLHEMIDQMADYEVGFGVQSFIPVNIEMFRTIALAPR